MKIAFQIKDSDKASYKRGHYNNLFISLVVYSGSDCLENNILDQKP